MAQFINASIYGANSNDWNRQMGVNKIFPVTLISPQQLRTPTVYSGVTCVTAINLLPTGLQTDNQTFYTDKTVAAILAQGNAPLA